LGSAPSQMGIRILDTNETSRLLRICRALVAAATVVPGDDTVHGPNRCGCALLTPGVNNAKTGIYPAFWIRDPAWIAQSGLATASDVWGWLTLITRTMNGPTAWRLRSGGVVLPYAVPDHINMDGTPVFYPGTYASDESQGPPFGKYPPHDDQYWLVFTASAHARLTCDWRAFGELVPTRKGAMVLADLCIRAHESFPTDPLTGLCVASSDADEHIVDWGYNDQVLKTGRLLFPSLLRLQSARDLAQACAALSRGNESAYYRRQAEVLSTAILATFLRSAGDGAYLASATGIGEQPDVWGTALAVYLGALPESVAKGLGRFLLDGYHERTMVRDGQVRHLPTNAGHWASSQAAPGTYQNGAYWAYPIGWYAYALSLVDSEAARELGLEFLRRIERDWDAGMASCAWECTNDEMGHRQNPGYAASAAMPYAALKASCMLDV